MYKYLLVLVAGLVVGLGLGYVFHPSKAPSEQVVGGIYNANQYNPQYFRNGLFYNTISSIGNAVSTTTPAAFGSASSGFFTVSAGQTVFTASTTAVDLNTDVNITQISTSTAGTSLNATLLAQLGGRVCNTTPATQTPVTSIYASSTATSLNGFTITLGTAPLTNPDCFSWSAQGF